MRRILIALVVVLGMLLGVLILVVGFWPQDQENAHKGVSSAQSAETQVRPISTLDPKDITQKNALCLQCHTTVGRVSEMSDGSQLSLNVDPKVLQGSVHGDKLLCLSCHVDSMGTPAVESLTLREYAVSRARACEACHQAEAAAYTVSSHGKAMSSGNLKAATCTDCHGFHGVQKASTLKTGQDSCALCHSNVVDTYKQSVHGQLVRSGRTDAAGCLDCHTPDRSPHEVQRVSEPNAVTSPKQQAETCGRCHPKPLETYLSTFHGMAMTLGVKDNAATCTDCHGTYGVQPVHGPEQNASLATTQMADNCARCHPGADENFVAGWMGHEEPSSEWFPLVHYAERFFFFLTTSVVAFGVLHVELDVLRWLANRRKERRIGRDDDAC